MNPQPDAGTLLSRALDQTAGLLDEVSTDQLDQASTCADWKVRDLVRHVVASPQNFVSMFSDKDVDWANPPELGNNPAEDFRTGAATLVEQVRADGSGRSSNAALPEFAVHNWDLAKSIGSRSPLDDEVAEHALAFMSAHLTAENRADAFEPEVETAPHMSVHDRLAAFAGRSPS